MSCCLYGGASSGPKNGASPSGSAGSWKSSRLQLRACSLPFPLLCSTLSSFLRASQRGLGPPSPNPFELKAFLLHSGCSAPHKGRRSWKISSPHPLPPCSVTPPSNPGLAGSFLCLPNYGQDSPPPGCPPRLSLLDWVFPVSLGISLQWHLFSNYMDAPSHLLDNSSSLG